MSFKSIVKGRTKTDHKNSTYHYVTGELKMNSDQHFQGKWLKFTQLQKSNVPGSSVFNRSNSICYFYRNSGKYFCHIIFNSDIWFHRRCQRFLQEL